jgi:two-component system, chemotaxis family, protein-glutamate methylesterase/glutaminase
MANRDVVVIGTSAGGIEALQQLLGGLPADFGASVLVVLHTSVHGSSRSSLLPAVLGRSANLPVVHPKDGERIEKGRVYIAPPDFHMVVEPGGMLRVIQGPRENLHRPAIDPLFRSAAASCGRKVIGVILTGMLDDGTSGLMLVRAAGGAAVIQDPESAMFSSMPSSALEQVMDAKVVPLGEIAELLVRLIGEELPARAPASDLRSTEKMNAIRETRIAEFEMAEIENESRPGRPSSFACPDCGGVLWEIDQDGFLRFRCRVGHAFTAKHLGSEQRQAVESALWAALRALEESGSLYRRMAERASVFEHSESARAYEERAANTETNSRTLKDFLLTVSVQDPMPSESEVL